MAETREKVYRLDTPDQRAAFQQDQASARQAGWLLSDRSFDPDGSLRATYRYGPAPTADPWAPPPSAPLPASDRPVPVYVREPPAVAIVKVVLGLVSLAIFWRLLGSPNHTDIINYVQDVATYIQTGAWPR